MKGSIPIIDKKGERVATLNWAGTLWAGKGKWEADAEMIAKLDAIVESRKDLSKVPFSDMATECGVGQVKGWKGFSGWFQALCQALPSYGLDVDRENIAWPFAPPTR